MNLTNKKVTILGLGKSGFESAKFLREQNALVFASDAQTNEILLQRKKELGSLGIEAELGQHHLDRIVKSDLIIISPGISPKSEVYQLIQKSQIPIWSEIELAYRFCPSPIIAITGTNGKTTVTTLINKILNEEGFSAVICGNIGNPFIGEVSKLTAQSIAVVEVSSFQLENIVQFRPSIAVLLNLTDNHFDRHGTFEAYVQAKWRVFENQLREDYAFINTADRESMRHVKSIRAKKIYFNKGESGNPNFAACLAVAGLYQLDLDRVTKTLQKFCGIEHRMESVPTNDGISYINDSKSTTIASLKWALGRMKKRTILIMGGRHKGGDFSQLMETVSEKVSFLILIGESARLIEEKLGTKVPKLKVESLPEAVRKARAVARQGDTILFSPACASFDMFRNYQDRGNQFREIVLRLQSSKSENMLEFSTLLGS